MNAPRPVPFGEALRRGFGLARHAPGVFGLGLVAEVASDLLSLGVGLSLGSVFAAALANLLIAGPLLALAPGDGAGGSLLGAIVGRTPLVPLLGAAVVAGLLALAFRVLWLSAAARVFGLRLAGEPAPSALPAGASRLDLAVRVVALLAPAWLAIGLFNVTAFGAGGLLALNGSRGAGWALSASAALAFALVVGFLLSAGFGLLLPLAVVRSVSAGESATRAVAGAGRLIASRLGALVLLRLLFTFLGGVAAAVAESGGAFVVGTGAAAVALAITTRALTGVVGSALGAFFATAELGAFSTLDAGARGVLPEPPRPPPARPAEPVLVAERVLETEVVLPTELR